MTATKTKPAKTGRQPKPGPDLSPVECKEHLDEVLDMEKEVEQLERKMNSSKKIYKDDKASFELKRDELVQYLKGLNEEHPLFDDKNTIDIPWAFPLPKDVLDATLANVAADPVVLGLSVSVVKAVRDKIKASTLGQLQGWLKAGHSFTPKEQTAGKKALAEAIGPSQAQKLLRAVASFVGNRARVKQPAAVPAESGKPAATTADDWRETKVADLEAITPMQAQLLAANNMPTVGKCLERFEQLLKDLKPGGPPDFLRKQLATFLALTTNSAGKLIDVIYAFEEKHTVKAS